MTTQSTPLQKGRVHCWDLRTDREAWMLQAPPELGFLTSLALGACVFISDMHVWPCIVGKRNSRSTKITSPKNNTSHPL